jgi:hypothetical protein
LHFCLPVALGFYGLIRAFTFTFHIGPEKPADAGNFIKTVPGRGWFSLFRFYGPEKAFFDRKYKPGDFVKVD